jgi:hypothetical protein
MKKERGTLANFWLMDAVPCMGAGLVIAVVPIVINPAGFRAFGSWEGVIFSF